MIFIYKSVKETALRWGISERRVRILCAEGRIPGAFQVGRGWSVPSDAVKPADSRFHTNALQSRSLEQKRDALASKRNFTSGETEALKNEFSIEYIYNSDALEGNAHSIKETAMVLSGMEVDGKSSSYRRKNLAHKKALDFVLDAATSKQELSIETILKIHSLVLEDKVEDRGTFRSVPVKAFGASYVPCQPYLIQSELERLLFEYSKSKEPVTTRLARFHITFESIRPFIDGNGRVGRLLVIMELIRLGYPPIIFRFSDRREYFNAFEVYHRSGDLSAMEQLIEKYMSEQLDAYLQISDSRPSVRSSIDRFIEKIIYRFRYEGNAISCENYGKGHINKTYLISTDTGKKYVLQEMSSVAFHDVPGLMANAISVAKHIRSKGGMSINYIPANDGNYYFKDENGEYWRSYEYVDALCLTSPERPEDFYESAIAFGTFQNMLNDFPADSLCVTIPKFHDTPDRYVKLHNAIDSDSLHRVKQVLKELEFALSREREAGQLIEMLDNGLLPLRVTHNDTKLNNVLLSKDTRRALCVIDLDTVMPGLSAYDFGDAIRYGAATSGEDEQDLDSVKINLYLFRLFARGYLKACPLLTENEKKALALGSKIITLECGVRFLTDYLEGDRYFGASYPEQNLHRARTQFRLVEDMEKHFSEMESIVEEESYRFI